MEDGKCVKWRYGKDAAYFLAKVHIRREWQIISVHFGF